MGLYSMKIMTQLWIRFTQEWRAKYSADADWLNDTSRIKNCKATIAQMKMNNPVADMNDAELSNISIDETY